ncbi:TetR/AcrR family transcriptional regulator [Glaesserella sp.]|uniref:TetR/AcrR family transcriptional regulator n=1 Tax=Glaesserella sp. TaxID=2094731 RepID=UPI0035A0D844
MNDRSVTLTDPFFMFDEILPRNEVAIRILNATEQLMAKEGVQNISTHKIAKEAGVSVGTIYLYFKDKESLLQQLVLYLFDAFHTAVDSKHDPTLPLFEQYKQMWRDTWQFMLSKPDIVKNIHQYESLPQFQTIMLECLKSEETTWNKFVRQGQENGVIALLPPFVLFAISMHTIWELMRQQLILGEVYSETILEEAILRTWKAITI